MISSPSSAFQPLSSSAAAVESSTTTVWASPDPAAPAVVTVAQPQPHVIQPYVPPPEHTVPFAIVQDQQQLQQQQLEQQQQQVFVASPNVPVVVTDATSGAGAAQNIVYPSNVVHHQFY